MRSLLTRVAATLVFAAGYALQLASGMMSCCLMCCHWCVLTTL